MSIPEPPSVSGITTNDYGNSKFFTTLFRFYSLITPKFNIRRRSNIQSELNALKNVKAEAFSGLNIGIIRNLSTNCLIRHNLILGADNEVPSYVNMIQYETGFKRAASHLWCNYGIGTQFVPSHGNIKTKLTTAVVLTKEADTPLPKNPNSLTLDLGLSSVSNWDDLDQTSFINSIGLNFDMPGSVLSINHDFERSSFQCAMYQQLAKRHFGGLILYGHPTPPYPAGLIASYRYESGNTKYPRNVYTGSINGNSIGGLSSLNFTYSHIFSKNFSWTSEIEKGAEVTASTGFDYHYRVFNIESALRCVVNHKGEMNCGFSDILGPLRYSILSSIDLQKNEFSIGLGFDVSLDTM